MARRCHRARRRHRRHLDRLAAGQARACRRAGRSARPGEETSYGNAGVIEGNTLFPPAFPSDPLALLRVALKRAPEANYHPDLPAPGCALAARVRAASTPRRLIETAARHAAAVCARAAEHEALLAEAARTDTCARKAGSSSTAATVPSQALKRELALAQEFGIRYRALDPDRRRASSSRASRRFSAMRCIGRAPPASPIRWP